ncbi:alpha/beta fold hydrolase [Kineococcus arenarius]|uniref:alpha/beta fold hydrolase n=1 Tax=unclassified Kineococcus TaxID=2621656 RepID=UPI003D7D7801
MKTFILVHGGGHGAWAWEPVIGPLQSRGHTVRTLDLPGRDNQPSNVTLDDWVRRVGQEVDWALAAGLERPTLVGHSMGGLSVSQLAERRPADISSVIYVCAVVPVDGENGLSTLAEGGLDSALLAEGALVPSEDGSCVTATPDAAHKAFYSLCEDGVAAAATSRLCAEPVAPLSTPLSLGANFASVRKSWIAATEDRTVPFALQERLAARCGAPLTSIEADHSPFFSATDELVDLLVQLA